MLTLIIYLIGVLIAFQLIYRGLGEESYETFPKVERKHKVFIVIMAIVLSVYSWVSVLIFYNRHKSFIKN